MAKILFVQQEFVPVGVESLLSFLKDADHQGMLACFEDPYDNNSFSLFKSKYFLNKFRHDLRVFIHTQRPDIIGFSAFTMNYRWALEMAKFIKTFWDAPIVFGGCHPTMVPEHVIVEPTVDMLCIGEGEHAIVGLLQAIDGHTTLDQVPNIWFKKDGRVIKNPMAPLITDLDALPFPHKALSPRSGSYLLMGSRGCPYRCSYCANNVYATLYPAWNRVRFRSVHNIIKELKNYTGQHPGEIKRIEIMDDVIALDNHRLRELCTSISTQTGLPYSCFLHPNLVDETSIQILKNTGCYWLKIGVQSTSETNRTQYLLRPEKQEKIRMVAGWCRAQGLFFSFDQIFGLPCDSAEDLKQSVVFYNQTQPKIINYGGLVYLPKTKIIDDALKSGILKDSDVIDINHGEHVSATDSNTKRLLGNPVDGIPTAALTSRVAYMYSLISFVPPALVTRMIKNGFLEKQRPVPVLIVIAAKVIAKIAARQFYIYWDVLKRTLTAPFRSKYFFGATPESRAATTKP